MPLNPISGSKAIKESYLSYLTTTFRIRDRGLQTQFERLLSEPDRLVKGPILEAMPPFEVSASLQDLMDQGVLSSLFVNISEKDLPKSRSLYRHQEEAIRKAVTHHRNLVVASRTGSGKTECFMVPILNDLMREYEQGILTPGVRALLLYPMNALANDQVKRLRQLLAGLPSITFGRYTGETEDKQKDAYDLYMRMYGEEPLPNEKISRTQMRLEPPHILLTNYAMLEYLLLRPEDTPFFDGLYARSWRFIVLDEAHTYSGAKGIEIAMLLRRLKERVDLSRKGSLQCFATSATLGNGIEDAPEISRFAKDLFDEEFAYIADEPLKQDIVVGRRVHYQYPALDQPDEPDRFRPDPHLYIAWQRVLHGYTENSGSPLTLETLARAGREHGVPYENLTRALVASKGSVDRFLFFALQHDQNVARLRTSLMDEPVALAKMARVLFPNAADATEALVALVDLAVRAKPDKESAPILPARYHLFIKAIEGAYLRFGPTQTLSLEPKDTEECDGRKWPVFEIATCRNCGHLYLYGHIDAESSSLRQNEPEGELRNAHYFMVVSGNSDSVEDDEDELVVFAVPEDQKSVGGYVLCTSCGKVWPENSLGLECSCTSDHHVCLLKAPSPQRVTYCQACGRRNPTGLVLRFLTGQDATATVIATSIYQSLSKMEELGAETEILATSGDVSGEQSAHWSPVQGDGVRENQLDEWAAQSFVVEDRQTERLLVFSDSRQDAAFFAPYFERTYNQILARSLIYRVISDYRGSIIGAAWRVSDLVRPLVKMAQGAGIVTQELSPRGQDSVAWTWILEEFLRYDRHNSLESLGMLSFSPARPAGWRPPGPLLTPPWNLSYEEVWGLMRVLLNSLRTNGAVLFPDEVSPTDEAFAPRNRPYYVRQYQSDRKRGVMAWSPSKGGLNARLDFLIRLADRLGIENPRDVSTEVLDRLWDSHLGPDNKRSVWARYFQALTQPRIGTVYQMRLDMWQIDISCSDDGTSGWYRCNVCGFISRVSVRGVCPNYKCTGVLKPLKSDTMLMKQIEPSRLLPLAREQEEGVNGTFHHHYARLYRTLDPVALNAKEHTAQLTSMEAASLQTKFTNGEVNVLSCSTTFELGVDLGTLEAVFLRNMPPTPANYVQRSGRAGRRTGSAAFVATYAQRRPHDLEYFRNPNRMVSGIIKPPHFKLANDKIIRRHIHAMALSYLWRTDKSIYGNGIVTDFFGARVGVCKLMDLLLARPKDLLESLVRTVPAEVHEEIGIHDWLWVDGLLDPEEGVLIRAADEFEQDTRVLNEALVTLQSQRRPSDYILKALNTVEKRRLINYLAARGVLPKYGFPVDSVELKLNSHAPEASRLELERDLRIALSEYAPGSKIIAGGKMWTSRYLRLLPRRSWIRYRFAICDNCGSYERVMVESSEPLVSCSCCNAPLAKVRQQGTYVVPEFGFGSEFAPAEDAPQARPPRYPFPRVYFYGPSLGESEEYARLRLNGVEMHARSAPKGKLAALNTYGRAGFNICFRCGYGVPGVQAPKKHKDSFDRECGGTLTRVSLGHEFETDVLLISFQGYEDSRDGFWHSLLYGLLEGLSLALDIERSDLDGCLYPKGGRLASPEIVLFDNVPGGAGHVRRAVDPGVLKKILQSTRSFLASCECGTSCSGCLRNFRNQYWHGKLNRQWVLDFLAEVL